MGFCYSKGTFHYTSKVKWNALFVTRKSRIHCSPTVLQLLYSIISVTDLSLPTKPCRTCKNRFHSSCLYRVRFIRSMHILTNICFSGSNRAVHPPVHSVVPTYSDVPIVEGLLDQTPCVNMLLSYLFSSRNLCMIILMRRRLASKQCISIFAQPDNKAN